MPPVQSFGREYLVPKVTNGSEDVYPLTADAKWEKRPIPGKWFCGTVAQATILEGTILGKGTAFEVAPTEDAYARNFLSGSQ